MSSCALGGVAVSPTPLAWGRRCRAAGVENSGDAEDFRGVVRRLPPPQGCFVVPGYWRIIGLLNLSKRSACLVDALRPFLCTLPSRFAQGRRPKGLGAKVGEWNQHFLRQTGARQGARQALVNRSMRTRESAPHLIAPRPPAKPSCYPPS